MAGAEPHRGFIERLEDIDEPQYQMCNLAGWGGLPVRHAHYIPITPRDERVLAGEPSSMTFWPPDLRYGDDAAANPLEVTENWNGLFRCYLPTSVEGILAFGDDLTMNHPVLPLSP